MTQTIYFIAPAIVFAALDSLRRCRSEIKARGKKLIENVFDPYRPELHYMRGPGPKWHARHGATTG
jgi:hypothetical protein